MYFDVIQYSEEWVKLRLGRPTASNFKRIFTPKKMEVSKQSDHYLYTLLAEYQLQRPAQEELVLWATERGKDLEPESVDYYELTTGTTTQEAGIFFDDTMRYGASPDRLIGDEGLLELKNLLPATHLNCLFGGVLPEEHKLQVYGQLFVSGRKWIDFLSYSPELPPLLVRVMPDKDMFEKLEVGLEEFLRQLEEKKKQLAALYEK